jgi:6-phosphogluconolactonase
LEPKRVCAGGGIVSWCDELRVVPSCERVTRFVYVGFGGEGAKEEGIAIYDLRGGRWKPMGVVESAAPSSLALDASERFLYAVNEVEEYEGLPSGTVEAYSIDAADGSLKFVNRQKLSLSATAPRHAAVSPDGKALVVAVHGGGAYNVLPLGGDGRVGAVSGILKETGSGSRDEQRSAHPQMVVFDRAGRVVSVDLGSDRLSVLKFDAMRLKTEGRYATQIGDGPRQVAFHPDGRLLFVANELDASVTCYGYDVEEGRIAGRLERWIRRESFCIRRIGGGAVACRYGGSREAPADCNGCRLSVKVGHDCTS